LAAAEPARWLVVDAMQPVDVVQAKIRDRILQSLEGVLPHEAHYGHRQQ